MNVLFVCDMGEIRSKTAAECLGFVSDFCGIDKLSCRPIHKLQIDWADKIVCMEDRHSLYLMSVFNVSPTKIQVWDIVDNYDYLDDTLIAFLRGKSEKYLHS